MVLPADLAKQDFERAVTRAFWRKILARITGENNELLPFDEVRQQLPLRGQHYTGLKQVPINKILGSIGRYHEFDRAFLPTQTRTKDRWISIGKAHYDMIDLPPVDLYKIGEVYFVKDGNHRVSVARERGQEFIDAYVTEIDSPVWLTADTTVDDIAKKKEQAKFFLQTHLDELRPDAHIELTVPQLYSRLLEHIDVHRWYLGEREGKEIPYQEAVTSWYDTVYIPLVEDIRDHGLLQSFPGVTETDLYLWVVEYQGYLREAFKDASGDEKTARAEAAEQLIEKYPEPRVKKLSSTLERMGWLSDYILETEKRAFLEKTHLNEIRPGSDVTTTMPGRYDVLLEHIAVHRWYMGEKRKAEVPYAEAVASWYDNVYMPLVEVIREQDILKYFPERTETDLYLWVIEQRSKLRDVYGSEVPIEDAAEKVVEKRGSKSKKRV